MKNRPFHARLRFALAGIAAGWRRERSLRTHVVFAALAAAALLVLRPGALWCALVALVAGLVIALELVNAAIEGIVDLLHPAVHPEIKAIKDMAAGAVLVMSIAALLVAAALIVDRADPVWRLLSQN